MGQFVALYEIISRRRARRARQRAQELAEIEERMLLIATELMADIARNVGALIAVHFEARPAINRRFWTRRRDRKYWEEILWPGPEEDFKKDLRIRKDTFQLIVDELRDVLLRQDVLPLRTRLSVSVEKRVAICLYFLGSTSEYPTVGRLFGVADSTVCEIVHEVCAAIVDKLEARFLRFLVG